MVVSNETFIAINDTGWGQADGYDQNRAFVRLGWQAGSKLRLEGGYMNQHINVVSGEDRQNHNLMLSAFTTF